jgi:CMP/dCMP kinase
VSPARPIVAIDGPAGAGKSTVARRLAAELGFLLVDTGALYRCVALAAKSEGVQYTDAARVSEIAHGLVSRGAIQWLPDGMLLDGRDVSKDIRTPDVAMGASTVSAHPEVRAALLDLQRQAGAKGGVVLEGRDIGTVVFPNAEVKFYLTAAAEVRAKRRHDELVIKGNAPSLAETLADVIRRDEQDTKRAVAPLRVADDAVVVESTGMTADDVVATMAAHVRRVSAK